MLIKMGNLFHKKSRPSRITQQDKAVLQLKEQRDKLRQYQKRIEASLAKDRLLAKSLIADGRKERALLLLRKKRYQETLLSNTDKQLQNIMQLASDIEFAQVEIEVVNGLQVGNRALKQLNDALNIDEIERILEETKEAYDKQEEISALLSGGLTSEDEDAVLTELEQLEAEDQRATADEAASIDFQLPDVPTSKINADQIRTKQKVAIEG